MDGAMRAVGGEDGRADVTADLCCSECTHLAAAFLAFQRGRRAVPPLMPTLYCSRAASYSMAGSERGEAVSGRVWSVFEEDVVLGFGAEVRHCCVESEAEE